MEFSFDEPFDAVFSNAALHWVKPPEKVIECVAKCLRPGGRFVAEFGGKGNVRLIFDAAEAAGRQLTGREVRNVNYFPSVAEYAAILESGGLEVRQAWLFDRPTKLEDGENGLRNWLTMFGEKTFGAMPEDICSQWIEGTQERARASLFSTVVTPRERKKGSRGDIRARLCSLGPTSRRSRRRSFRNGKGKHKRSQGRRRRGKLAAGAER